jgi:Trk K+ transport system NAD-binding subunit
MEAETPAWQSIAEALPIDESDIDLVEIKVTPDLGIAGQTLAQSPLRPGMLVIAVLRKNDTVIPTGATLILPDDILVLSIDERTIEFTDVTAWARGEWQSGRDDATDADGPVL